MLLTAKVWKLVRVNENISIPKYSTWRRTEPLVTIAATTACATVAASGKTASRRGEGGALAYAPAEGLAALRTLAPTHGRPAGLEHTPRRVV
jgi:hypothetical protein